MDSVSYFPATKFDWLKQVFVNVDRSMVLY